MIKLFRLTTGEDIVGEVLLSPEGVYRVKNPCAIGLTMAQNGTAGLNMQPWLLFSDDTEVDIKDEHVMYVTGVDIKIQNKYNEIFGSGIVIAQQPLKVR